MSTANETPTPTPPTEGAATKAATGVPENRPIVEPVVDYDPWKHVELAEVGDIINAEPGYDYRAEPTRAYPADGRKLDDWRNKLAARGFEPCNGPRAKGSCKEFHRTEPTAEIWRRKVSLADAEFRVRMYESTLRRSFAEYYLRHHEKDATLPKRLKAAMLQYHGLAPVKVGRERPDKDTLRRLCARLEVHPGPVVELD